MKVEVDGSVLETVGQNAAGATIDVVIKIKTRIIEF